jgi:general L-amino acid transport system substrate-binding protein
LVNNKLGVKSAKELDGATICIQAGTTTELNVSDYFRANNLKYTPITFDTSDESAKSLDRSLRRADLRQVPAVRPAQQAGLAERLRGLPETISKEPLGPVVRKGDDEWFSHRALDPVPCSTLKKPASPRRTSKLKPSPPKPGRCPPAGCGRRIRQRPETAEGLGCADRQAGRQLRRSVREKPRQKHPLEIDRAERLWNNGGIQYAPPVR